MAEARQDKRTLIQRSRLLLIASAAFVLPPGQAYAELRDKLPSPLEYAATIIFILIIQLVLIYAARKINHIFYYQIISILINLFFFAFYVLIIQEMIDLNIPPPWRMKYDMEGYSPVYIAPMCGILFCIGHTCSLKRTKKIELMHNQGRNPR